MPKNNPPKQFGERSFEQGDRKWQQDELELGFELVDGFFWSKTKCVGERISRGDPHGVHEAGGEPRGWARPPPSWAHGGAPWCAPSANNS